MHINDFSINFFYSFLITQAPEKIVDSPDLLDDYHLNLLDWGSANVLSIALSNTVYLWNGTNNSASKLATVDQEYGPVTSVSWAPDGRRIAVGLNSSDVQIWDSDSRKLVCFINFSLCCIYISRIF